MNEATMRSLFTLAGIGVIRLWRLPNGYLGDLEPLTDNEVVRDTSKGGAGYVETNVDKDSPDPTVNVVRSWMSDYRWRNASPAWLVKTSYGLIQIGWRKRVIAIEWSDTPIRTIVTDDNVTKSDTMVHAWSEETALKYLKALTASR